MAGLQILWVVGLILAYVAGFLMDILTANSILTAYETSETQRK